MIYSTLLFILYVVITSIIYGIPTSLSATYLMLQPGRKNLFSLSMIVIVFLVLITMLSKIQDLYTITLTSIACTGLAFVAIFAQFLDKFQKIFHFIGAGTAALSTIIWTFIMFKHEIWLFIPILLISIVIPLIFNKKKLTFWLEMGCFFNYFLIANLIYYNII